MRTARSLSTSQNCKEGSAMDILRGRQRIYLIGDIAQGEDHETLAKRYEVPLSEIKAFARRYHVEIAEVKAALRGALRYRTIRS
jgi:uncharacterized protein (DUF433 family)